MALVEVTPQTNQRPKMTVDQAFERAKQMSKMLYQQLDNQHRMLFNFLWRNPDVTIDEFLVKYGTDATALFQVSGKIQEVLALSNPAYVPLVPLKPVTFNEDKTVTITQEVK